MHRALVLLIAGILAGVLLPGKSAAQASALSPELHQRMAATGASGKVPVIVRFAEGLDLRAFAPRSARGAARAAARAGMVRGLRDQARRSQGPLQGFLRRQGTEPAELWLINALAVRVPPALVETLASWPGVAAVELDGQVPPPAPVMLAVPTAPTGNIATLGVQALWDKGFTGSGVVVASFDSGVDVTHPDLALSWRGGPNPNSWFDPYTSSPLPYDSGVDKGHGTAVTSLMVGGAMPTTLGGNTVGVAPGAQWIAAKIFPDIGDADNSKIIAAFQWALDPDHNPLTDDAPDVINNSWGFDPATNQCTDIVDPLAPISLKLAIQNVQAAGIHVVFSAGNSGPAAATSVSPGNYPEGLVVGSIGPGFAVSSFSSRGPSPCSGSIYTDLVTDVYPELVAQGELIEVAYPRSIFPLGYATVSGTSFSAPQVAGALALLRSAVLPLPAETPADYRLRLERALLESSADLGPPGADNSYGRGLVDLPAAYARLTAQPHLSVYDPTAPENDDRLDFGSITPGKIQDLAFVLRNSGGADLIISASSSPATELTLVDNTCLATLAPGAQCTLTVRFAPTTFGSSAGGIVITSNQSVRTLTITGIGNSLPPPAELLAPANNAALLARPVTFSWIQGADADGDALTQTLLIATNPHFDSPARTILVLAGGSSGMLIAVSGFFLWPLPGKRRRLLLAAGVLVALGLMVSCGGGGGGGTVIEPTDRITVTDLSAATTYYWKVRTEDSHDGVSESEVRSFKTR